MELHDVCARLERELTACADEVAAVSRELVESRCAAAPLVMRAVAALRDYADEIATAARGWAE